MNLLSIDHLDLRELINAFNQGKIICLPTDTIYAISSDAANELAIKKIYQIKHRPMEKTLSIFVSDINMAQDYVRFSSKQLQFIQKIWPGPMTIISEVSNHFRLPSILIKNNKVALRVPDDPLIQYICKEIKRPIIATSANVSSEVYDNDYHIIQRTFSNYVDIIIEQSSTIKDNNKKPSSIIEFTNNSFKVVREGNITFEQINRYFDNHL